MSTNNQVQPLGYVLARELSREELNEVSGGAATATVSGSGGGNNINHIGIGSIDADGDISF